MLLSDAACKTTLAKAIAEPFSACNCPLIPPVCAKREWSEKNNKKV